MGSRMWRAASAHWPRRGICEPAATSTNAGLSTSGIQSAYESDITATKSRDGVPQRDVDYDPDGIVAQAIDEDRPRSTADHVPIALQRQAHATQFNPHHPRAVARTRPEPQRSTHDRRPPRPRRRSAVALRDSSAPSRVNATEWSSTARTRAWSMKSIPGSSATASRRRETSASCSHAKTAGSFRVPEALSAPTGPPETRRIPLPVALCGCVSELYPEIVEHAHGGGMQPLACEPSRDVRVRLQQSHRGTSASVGERAPGCRQDPLRRRRRRNSGQRRRSARYVHLRAAPATEPTRRLGSGHPATVVRSGTPPPS